MKPLKTFEDLEAMLRHWVSFADPHLYDAGGMVLLFAACLDNMRLHMLEAELEDIDSYFTDEQKEFCSSSRRWYDVLNRRASILTPAAQALAVAHPCQSHGHLLLTGCRLLWSRGNWERHIQPRHPEVTEQDIAYALTAPQRRWMASKPRNGCFRQGLRRA